MSSPQGASCEVYKLVKKLELKTSCSIIKYLLKQMENFASLSKRMYILNFVELIMMFQRSSLCSVINHNLLKMGTEIV